MKSLPIHKNREPQLSIQKRAEMSLLPDKLLIKEIGELMYENESDRYNAYEHIIEACKTGTLKYSCDIEHHDGIESFKPIDDWQMNWDKRYGDYETEYFKQKCHENHTSLDCIHAFCDEGMNVDYHRVLDPPKCLITRDDFKVYLQGIGYWPLKNCLLAYWWQDLNNNDTGQKESGYDERDKLARELVEQKPKLLTMRPAEIKLELQKNPIFLSGYTDWWRRHSVFPKGRPGRNRKNINKI